MVLFHHSTLNFATMNSKTFNEMVNDAEQALYQIPRGTTIDLPVQFFMFCPDNETNKDCYCEVISLTRNIGFGVSLSVKLFPEDTDDTEQDITLSDIPNRSQLVALFEACKQARPDLFEDAQPAPAIRCNNCMTTFVCEDDLERREDEDGSFDGCPKCKTDAYLMNLDAQQEEQTPDSYKILNVTASSVGILVEKLIQKQQAENFTERYLRALFTQMPTTPAEIVQAADAAGMKDALLAVIMDSYEVNPMV